MLNIESKRYLEFSAAVCAICVVGHFDMGMKITRSNQSTKEQKVSKKALSYAWFQACLYFTISGLQFMRWSKSGIQDNFDRLAYLTLLLNNTVSGLYYLNLRVLPPGLAYLAQTIAMIKFYFF